MKRDNLLIEGKELLIEGKTKKVFSHSHGQVVIESKDDITAGDGAKHDIMVGKGKYANETTCNVFSFLKKCELPVAFIERINDTKFLGIECQMTPLEVVVRREAHGSYIKRNPHLKKGHYFPKLIVEFFLKTSNKQWRGTEIPKDDPFIVFQGLCMGLYLPDQPLYQQKPFDTIFEDTQINSSNMQEMSKIALKTFLVLEKAWQLLGRKLVDFKVEFGVDKDGQLLLADVIDNDSWRIIDDGRYIDKQLYREGSALDIVLENYKLVSELTSNFTIPEQEIILWTGSDSDDPGIFYEAFNPYKKTCGLTRVSQSVHKNPAQAYQNITNIIQENPDSVLIAYVGKSNGAGPTLSAQATIPTITVPANWKEYSEDIWSSLHVPSNVPVMTVLDPKNALLAALQILAMRNPWLYAELRLKQEERLCNIVEI